MDAEKSVSIVMPVTTSPATTPVSPYPPTARLPTRKETAQNAKAVSTLRMENVLLMSSPLHTVLNTGISIQEANG